MVALLRGHTSMHIDRWVKDALSGVAHCQRIGLVHRDIKPENILCRSDGRLMLCDFSRALFAPTPIRTSFNGTVNYAAPEALVDRWCCLANDVWSLGVVLYCVVEGLFPFDEPEDPDGCRRSWVRRGKRPELSFTNTFWTAGDHLGLELPHVISAMLSLDVEARPSIFPPSASIARLLLDGCEQSKTS